MAQSAAQKIEYMTPGLNPPISHYCDAVGFGNLLFISGVAPLDENQKLVGEGDVELQAEAVFQAMEKILKQANATFADILKVTLFLTDVDDRHKINPLRKKYFGDARPASTLFEVTRLAFPGMKLEIEAIVGLKPAVASA